MAHRLRAAGDPPSDRRGSVRNGLWDAAGRIRMIVPHVDGGSGVGMDHKLVVDLVSCRCHRGHRLHHNWTGVLMCSSRCGSGVCACRGCGCCFPFLPRRGAGAAADPHDGRMGCRGIVPSRTDKMASISVDKGLARLGSIGDFYASSSRTNRGAPDHHRGTEIRGVVETIMLRENPHLWHDLPPIVREACSPASSSNCRRSSTSHRRDRREHRPADRRQADGDLLLRAHPQLICDLFR